MKKSYLNCPYGSCGEFVISGLRMHVKKSHPDKFEEFTKNYEELKKKAVVRDSGTKQPVTAGDPPKVEVPAAPVPAAPDPEKPVAKKPEEKGKGDPKPPQAKSFLEEFGDWLDSPDL